MMLFFLLLFQVISNSEELIPDPLNYQEMPFTVLSYDVRLDLTQYAKREVIGICTIKVVRHIKYDGDYFIFHLNSLKINGIISNGKNLNYASVGDEGSRLFHYRVDYPDNETDTLDFIINYSGVMKTEDGGTMSWGGVHYEEAVLYALGVGFRAPYISTTRHWLPCFDIPQNKAIFRGKFKIPSNFMVASNGYLNAINDNGDGTSEYEWIHDYPTATYLLTFAAGPYKLIDYFDYKIPIQVFSLAVDSVGSAFAYSEVPQMNDCFEGLFGDYPFEKIGYTNVRRGAMEHQTMVSMPRSIIVQLNSQKNSNNEIAAHELSHMWFGNMVTPLDFKHAWLNESFATYCESLWLRCRNGQEDYLKNQVKKANNYLNLISKSEGIFPLYDFPRDLPSSNYPQTIYEKGAVILGMLAWHLKKEGYNFEDVISEYLRIFAYGNAQTNDVFRVLESETNLDWNWFADQWIYKGGWPRFDIIFDEIKDNKYSTRMEILQVQEGNLFINVPLELNFNLSDGTTLDTVLTISNAKTDIEIILPKSVEITDVKANQGKIVAGLYEVSAIKSATSVLDTNRVKFLVQRDGHFININYETSAKKIKVVVVDLLGRTLYQHEENINPGMNSMRFYMDKFSSGVYLLKIQTGDKYYFHKIDFQH